MITSLEGQQSLTSGTYVARPPDRRYNKQAQGGIKPPRVVTNGADISLASLGVARWGRSVALVTVPMTYTKAMAKTDFSKALNNVGR